MPLRSHRFASSGLVSALSAPGRKAVLVVTNEPRMRRAWYEGLNCGGGITGIWCPAVIDNDPEPFTRAYQTVANLTYSPDAWPYRHDGQPGAPTAYRSYPYDTGATALDLTDGIPADFCPGGFRELMFDASTPIGGDEEIFRASLSNSYTAAGNPLWYQDQLTIKACWHGPAEDATGANPIIGSPGLVAACWRDNGSRTIGTSAGSSVNAGIYAASVTLAAGSGMPRGAAYGLGDEAFSMLGTRACLLGVYMRSATAVNGIDLIVIDVPTIQNIDLGIAADQGSPGGGGDGSGGGFPASAIQALATALGITSFAAVILDATSSIGAGFANLSFQDDTTDCATGVAQPNAITEFTTDWTNNLRSASVIGQAPICLVSGHFYGHMADSSLTAGPSFSVANTFRRTITDAYSWMTDHPSDTHDGVARGAFLNFYDFGGSDGPASPTTQNTILASGVIQNGLADSSKIKGAYSAATNYAAGDGVYDVTDGVNAYGATRWFECLLTNGPATTVRATSNATYWTPLDFRPTATLAAAKVSLFVNELADAEASGGAVRGSRSSGRSQRPIGGVR